MIESDNPHNLWPGYNLDIYNQNYKSTYDEFNDELIHYRYSNNGVDLVHLYFSKLAWDSNHFGFNCCKIHIQFLTKNISDDLIAIIKIEINELLTFNKVKFVFADIPSSNPYEAYFVQHIGFNFMVNWLDGFIESKNVEIVDQENTVLSEDDILRFQKLANDNYFKGGRFYSDKNFEIEKINQLYANLIKNSFNENNLIISDNIDGNNFGITISKSIVEYKYNNDLKVAHLRFLLIDPKVRGKKLGEKLLKFSLSELSKKSDIITTGIESNNLISINLHAKLGFKFNYSHNAFHYWNSKVNMD